MREGRLKHFFILFSLRYALRLLYLLPFFYVNSVLAQVQPVQRYNRIQYHTYKWQVYHDKEFNIYFPAGADSLGAFIATQLPEALEQMKKIVPRSISKPPNIIIYPATDQQYETNIGSFQPVNYTLPTFVYKGARLVLAYNGNYADLKQQLTEALARALWEDQFNEGGLEEQAKGGKGEQIPTWFKEGTIRYFAHGWTIANEDDFRRSFEEKAFPNWQSVIAYEPRLAGQAFCYYLTDVYYKQAVTQLFAQLKVKKTLARAARLITKKQLDTLYDQCYHFYRNRFAATQGKMVISVKDSLTIPRKKGIISGILLSQQKQYISYITTTYEKRVLYVYDTRSAHTYKITTYSIPPWITDHSADSYPIVQWDKTGNQLYVALPIKGKITIKRYTPEGSLLESDKLYGVDGLRAFTPMAGRKFLLAAYRKGQCDIVQYDDNKEKYTPYTDDSYDDEMPVTDENGKLFFISSRPEHMKQKIWKIGVGYDPDTLWQGIYSIQDKILKPVIADTTAYVQYDNLQMLPDGQLLATSTKFGTKRFILLSPGHLPGTIFSRYQPYQYLPEKNEIAISHVGKDSMQVVTEPMMQWQQENSGIKADTVSNWLADYYKHKAEQAKEDSLLRKASGGPPSFLERALQPHDSAKTASHARDSIRQTKEDIWKKRKPYVLQLHSAYFTTQVNNDYFINHYQPYQTNLGLFKFPELGGLAKGGFTDLFENHNFSIGYKLPAATQGSSFFVTYLNTAKKADWSVTYFRDVESLQPDTGSNWTDEQGRRYPGLAKVKTHYYEVSVHYPINYDISLGFQTAVRQDQTVFQATDKYSLDFADLKSTWSINTLSAEVNKLQLTLPNLFKGFYGKAIVDVFKGFSQQEAILTGNSLQLAYHQPLYKYITLVGQLHAGISAGDQYILYNLGGVDNNVTVRADSSKHFLQTAPYAFQALVTPFRGYYQNTVYGNRYALINADVYFPIFRTLIPIETALPSINDLQLGLFSDFATANETWNNANGNNGKWLSSYGLSARTNLAGYNLRVDIAWPGSFKRQSVIYLSLLSFTI